MSGREKDYAEYKAQRPPRPDLLREQWPQMMQLVEAFGYANIRVEGYEADDVIASLARQAGERGDPGDGRLRRPRRLPAGADGIRVMTTSRGITDTKVYDRDGVIERYGVAARAGPRPDRAQGGHLGQHPRRPGDRRQDRRPAAAGVRLARGGARERRQGLRREAEAEPDRARRRRPDLEAAGDGGYDVETGVDLARCWRRSRIEAACASSCASSSCGRCSSASRRGWATASAVPGRRVEQRDRGRGRGGGDRGAARGPDRAGDPAGRWAGAPDAERVITGEASLDRACRARFDGAPLVAHDAKSLGGGRHGLLAAAARLGVGIDIDHDTMLAAYLLEPQRRGYELRRAGRGRGHRGAARRRGRGAGRGRGATARARRGGGEPRLDPAEEARIVAELAEWQRPRLDEWELERLLRGGRDAAGEVLAAMEREGVKLDVERLAEIGAGFDEQIEQLESEIYELAGHEFTIGSPQQVGNVLFEELGLTRKRRGKTGFSTDARVLAQIRERAPDRREDRDLARADQAEEHLPRHAARPDRPRHGPHPHDLQPGVDHDRPALQHQPEPAEHPDPHRDRAAGPRLLRRRARARGCCPPTTARSSCGSSPTSPSEEVLKEIFRAGEDVHAATAAEVFDIAPDEVDVGQRSKAKMVNFGIVYGLTGFGMADRLNIPREEGEEFVARYLERFPAVRAFREETIERAQADGYVTTLMGRRRPIPELRSPQSQHPPAGGAAGGQHGDPGNRRRHHQGRDGPLPRGPARAGSARPASSSRSTTSCCSRGRAGRWRRRPRWSRREMCGAYELDPPLEVDVGVGKDWLGVK